MKKVLMTLILGIATTVCALAAGSGFTMWQLPSQENSIGNSYVFRTDGGKIIVFDGGFRTQDNYMRGFLAALGNEVEAWYISHPHVDHCGCLTQILEDQKPGGVKINNIYHSRFSDQHINDEETSAPDTYKFYEALDKAAADGRVNVHDMHEAEIGKEFKYDGMNLKILSVTNEELRTNPYNNSSMIMRVWDNNKSILFLGDSGIECGQKLYDRLAKEGKTGLLNCDYVQMAHHGQNGVSEEFYKTIDFKGCLWSTPSWVWTNDFGAGPGTGTLHTAETRQWMDEKGIKEHHVTCLEGVWKLD